MKNSYKRREQLCKLHGPVVPGEDNANHRINHYPVDSIVCFVSTYPLDSDLSGVKVLAPSFSVVMQLQHPIYPTVPPTPYFFLYSWISFGYNVTSFYINIHTLIFFFSFSLYFYFIYFYFLYLNIFFRVPGCSGMFWDVVGCSGMFWDVPECSMFLVLSTDGFQN